MKGQQESPSGSLWGVPIGDVPTTSPDGRVWLGCTPSQSIKSTCKVVADNRTHILSCFLKLLGVYQFAVQDKSDSAFLESAYIAGGAPLFASK